MSGEAAILITGASGRLGSATLDAILRRWPGRHVVAVDVVPPHRKLPGVDYVTSDVADLCNCAPDLAARQCAWEVVWLAAQIGVEPLPLAGLHSLISSNLVSALLGLDGLRGHVGRLVYAGSVEAYGPPTTPSAVYEEAQELRAETAYGITKMLMEEHLAVRCERNGTSYVSLRLASLYGPHEPLPKAITDFLRTASSGGEIVLHGDGSSLRDYLYLDDAAGAMVRALETNTEGAVNVAHPERESLLGLARLAIDICGRGSVRFEHRDAPRRDRVMDLTRMGRDLRYACHVNACEGMRRVATAEGLI